MMHQLYSRLVEEAHSQTEQALKLVDEMREAAAVRAKYELLRELVEEVKNMPTYQVYGEQLVMLDNLLDILERQIKKL